MQNFTQFRLAVREIFDETLRSIDAGEVVRQALRLDRSRLFLRDTVIELRDRAIYAIAIGKAAQPMALALEQSVGHSLKGGVIIGPPSSPHSPALTPDGPGRHWSHFFGGHPLPTEASLRSAQAAFAILERANEERALLVFLISGGGSAMIEWPIQHDITLADLRITNEVLIGSGASIAQINAVRRAFSAVKGGRLAARAPDCDQITLIVSDVPPGQEQNVASGPTLPPPLEGPLARDVIAHYNLRSQLPTSIVQTIQNAQQFEMRSEALGDYWVLLDNTDALKAAAAAARRRDFVCAVASEISDQPIREGCILLVQRLKQLRKHGGGTVCLISGGEFACPVNGNGTGGRNLETALRLAASHEFPSMQAVALCGGTDGIDGNSPAAGAIVDSTTVQRAKTVGLEPNDFLQRSDSYSFFVALGDAIATGATGTNVRDLRILLAPPSSD